MNTNVTSQREFQSNFYSLSNSVSRCFCCFLGVHLLLLKCEGLINQMHFYRIAIKTTEFFNLKILMKNFDFFRKTLVSNLVSKLPMDGTIRFFFVKISCHCGDAFKVVVFVDAIRL